MPKLSPVKDIEGRLVEIVPSVKLDFLQILAEEIAAWNEKEMARVGATAIHGGRMAGQALSYVDEEDQIGTWLLVGRSPDGKNCEDCLALHGSRMKYAQFLDTKYTTVCGGNCRCDFETDGSAPEPLTMDEVEAALDAQP